MKLQTRHGHIPHFLRYIFDSQLQRVLILLKHLEHLDQQIELLRSRACPVTGPLQVLQKLVHLLGDYILVLEVALRPVSHVVEHAPLVVHVEGVVFA